METWIYAQRFACLQRLTTRLILQVAYALDACICEFENAEKPFPHNNLDAVERGAVKCNQDVNPQKVSRHKLMEYNL